jgi:hypothetical protein
MLRSKYDIFKLRMTTHQLMAQTKALVTKSKCWHEFMKISHTLKASLITNLNETNFFFNDQQNQGQSRMSETW